MAEPGEAEGALHLAYLGDAEIGDRTNVGAGLITANYLRRDGASEGAHHNRP